MFRATAPASSAPGSPDALMKELRQGRLPNERRWAMGHAKLGFDVIFDTELERVPVVAAAVDGYLSSPPAPPAEWASGRPVRAAMYDALDPRFIAWAGFDPRFANLNSELAGRNRMMRAADARTAGTLVGLADSVARGSRAGRQFVAEVAEGTYHARPSFLSVDEVQDVVREHGYIGAVRIAMIDSRALLRWANWRRQQMGVPADPLPDDETGDAEWTVTLVNQWRQFAPTRQAELHRQYLANMREIEAYRAEQQRKDELAQLKDDIMREIHLRS